MEFSVPGFIKRFCQPNALITMAEYLEDYAPPETKKTGYLLLEEKLAYMDNDNLKQQLVDKLQLIKRREKGPLFLVYELYKLL